MIRLLRDPTPVSQVSMPIRTRRIRGAYDRGGADTGKTGYSDKSVIDPLLAESWKRTRTAWRDIPSPPWTFISQRRKKYMTADDVVYSMLR